MRMVHAAAGLLTLAVAVPAAGAQAPDPGRQSFESRCARCHGADGRTCLGGSQRIAPDPVPQRILRALDIRTGEIRWELPQAGPGNSWGGTLATASGLVIFGEDSGSLVAVDASSGEPLWSFPTNHLWKASPMTYVFDGKQYVAVAARSNIIAFAIQEPSGSR